jgi:hypothetical protein
LLLGTNECDCKLTLSRPLWCAILLDRGFSRTITRIRFPHAKTR